MATYGPGLRRGLPRVEGGEGWPTQGETPVAVVGAVSAVAVSGPPSTAASHPAAGSTGGSSVPTPPQVAPAPPAADTSAPTALRRGLPRSEGGDPWPPASAARPAVAAEAPAHSTSGTAVGPAAEGAPLVAGAVVLRRGLPRVAGGDPWPVVEAAHSAAPAAPNAPDPAPAESPASRAEEDPSPPAAVSSEAITRTDLTYEEGPELRRGLPRVPGGDGWPPAGAVARRVVETARQAAQPAEPAPAAAESVPAAAPAMQPAAKKEEKPEAKKPEPKRYGRFTLKQWIGAGVVGVLGLGALAATAVFFVRWLLTTDPLVEFLAAYPGEYHLPEGAPVGFPGWLGWQHFFNAFLMILIIRSGLQVRREQRPPAYWTPKKNPSGKVSLTVWIHQSLDILWLVNGAVFIVLLFVTGQWMRVIPTSWEVFPNALSAMLQYISLDWPTDNGWVNYNGLQQLAYFTTIFIAAPLAAATGYRMSGMWPKNAKALNKAYPVEWARAIHFPVMLYFVVFIAIHVLLVLSTGALRNLNHMYAAQGSADPAAYADNWLGFWMFLASLVVIAAAWVAARPMVLAPIARLFGNVSSR